MLHQIEHKIREDQRITPEEGLFLYERAELGFLGMMAELIKQRKSGNEVYYILNFHIEPTNICINKCNFCSYSHHFSPMQWDLPVEEMLQTVRQQEPEVREVHITGAVHPDKDLFYYADLLKKIKQLRPDLHVKALSAVELDYIAKKANLTYKKALHFLKEAGLDSIPGGGAEIFDEEIRRRICQKTSSRNWLEIHEAAHGLGLSSNATMLYGHIENYGHRISHLEMLRQLQDKTRGFNAFIPLKFRNRNNEMKGIKEVPVTEDMRNYAVSRIYLDNFPHLKGYWPMIGKAHAQLALSFGVDDMDGTIKDSTKIYSMAGADEQNPEMTVSEMQKLISDAKKTPVERDSLYNKI